MKEAQPEIVMKFLAFLSLLFLALPAAAQNGLSAEERRIEQPDDAASQGGGFLCAGKPSPACGRGRGPAQRGEPALGRRPEG